MNICVACLLYFSHSIGCLFIHSFISFSFFLSIIHFLYFLLSFLPLLQSIIFDHYPQGASSAGWTFKKQICLSNGIFNLNRDPDGCINFVPTTDAKEGCSHPENFSP